MKTRTFIIAITLILGGIIGAWIHKGFFAPQHHPSQLKLEEILSIKELHLVKHTYKDLFFLHRNNDPDKAIRAIVQVPVTITSYVNLKEIELVKVNDSIKTVILPHARLNAPGYEIDKMVVSKTRAFQLHAGKDLYPEVSRYLQSAITQRMDSIRTTAIRNRILEQAEAEGKEYIETVLKAVGRPDIKVSFGDASKDEEIQAIQTTYKIRSREILRTRTDTTHYIIDNLAVQWMLLK
jgi:hypothetical protein